MNSRGGATRTTPAASEGVIGTRGIVPRLYHDIFFITHHASRITHHASRITHHASRITHHASRITPISVLSSSCLTQLILFSFPVQLSRDQQQATDLDLQ
ncbi:hypothetical protein F0224_14060 [Vibrio coralliilyticus]|nr:hypothetical protein [Vibrio coralliilyticus]